MMNFRQWQQNKPWKANKKEILQFWSTLPPSLVINQPKLIPSGYKGSSYKFDGIRITGSKNFITSVLSKIKDLLTFEGSNSRLEVTYKQQVDSKTQTPIPDSYVFYVQIKERSE